MINWQSKSYWSGSKQVRNYSFIFMEAHANKNRPSLHQTQQSNIRQRHISTIHQILICLPRSPRLHTSLDQSKGISPILRYTQTLDHQETTMSLATNLANSSTSCITIKNQYKYTIQYSCVRSLRHKQLANLYYTTTVWTLWKTLHDHFLECLQHYKYTHTYSNHQHQINKQLHRQALLQLLAQSHKLVSI